MKYRSRSYSDAAINSALLGSFAGFSQYRVADILRIPRTTIREWVHDYAKGRLVYPTVPDHAHHWVLKDDPNGVTCGVCKICFQEKEFPRPFRGIWTRGAEAWRDLSAN